VGTFSALFWKAKDEALPVGERQSVSFVNRQFVSQPIRGLVEVPPPQGVGGDHGEMYWCWLAGWLAVESIAMCAF
jgi:hypothetical protein